MSPHRFIPGTSFAWHATTYVVRRVLDQQVVVEAVGTMTVTTVALSTLMQALFNGTLHFSTAPTAPGATTVRLQPDANGGRDLQDYPADLVEIARARLNAIQPLLALAPGQRTRAALVERSRVLRAAQQGGSLATRLPAVSVASLYRWIADYTQSGHDLRALIPRTRKRGGSGHGRLAPEVEALIDDVLRRSYLVREAVTIDDVWNAILARLADANQTRAPDAQLAPPARATVARRIDQLDLRERLAARRGPRAARQA
ncbi:MAG TPA: helix-turn-helix domain-containing protein, partial [Herpetosiphonaceae bacterium]|nr:helix-turn-helix domain-containing protein [Herpetosiphonaceae bacterium]